MFTKIGVWHATEGRQRRIHTARVARLSVPVCFQNKHIYGLY